MFLCRSLPPPVTASRLFGCRLNQLADEAYALSRFDEAFDLYSEALRSDPEDYSATAILFANRAAVLMNMGRDQQALQDCHEVSMSVFLCYLPRAVLNIVEPCVR